MPVTRYRPIRRFVVAVALTVVACTVVNASEDASTTTHDPAASVVLIALDGVRWQELFHGCEVERSRDPDCATRTPAPNLTHLARHEGAALGAPGRSVLRVSGPSFVSLPGYQQMFTGRRQVECVSNECGRVEQPTLAEAVLDRHGRSQVAVFSSWPTLAEAVARDPDRVPVSSGRDGGYRADAETAALALAHAREHSPRLLFVGLGDTDEAAHTGDYDAYLAALRRADAWVARFVDWARERTAMGHPTSVFVTTDHGRAPDFKEHERAPDAADIWLVATGPAVKGRGWLASEPRSLADLAPTLADVLGVPLPSADGRAIEALGGKPQRLALARYRPE